MAPAFPRLQVAAADGNQRAPLATAITMRCPPSVLWHAMSGTIGSLLAECILFPMDRIKLQIQTAAAGDSSGFVATFLRAINERGIAGLYGGIGASMIKEFIHSLNFWLWHGFLFRYVAQFDDTSQTPTMSRLLLNMIAKQLNWLCTVPFEAISNVNQLSENGLGFFSTATSMYREGGIGAFYRGLPVSLVLAINPAIMNTLITSLLRVSTAYREARGEDYLDSRDHGAATVGVATAVAKAVATFATYPLIRAKVLQQTSGKTISLIAVLKQVVASEGVRGLYRGVLAMSYKTVLWNTLMMAVKHVLGPKRAVTPPGSPAARGLMNTAGRRVPLLAREPFPVELVTVEKLNEILSYVKLEHADTHKKRIDKLEDGLSEATQEIREMKFLLIEIASAVNKQAPITAANALRGENDLYQDSNSVPPFPAEMCASNLPSMNRGARGDRRVNFGGDILRS